MSNKKLDIAIKMWLLPSFEILVPCINNLRRIPCLKSVKCIEDKNTFHSIDAAALHYRVSKHTIIRSINHGKIAKSIKKTFISIIKE